MERAGSEGEWERSSASALVIHYIEQGTGTRGSKVGAQLGHGCHARPRVVHRGIFPNRWRAATWARWALLLGHLWAD